MTNRMIRLAVSLLFFSSLAFAQTSQPNLNGFDGVVEQVMKEWKVPGIAVAIVKDGKVVHAQGYGYRDVKRGLKVTPDTLFAIGSCSKAFTAAALGILVDEKKLEWDTPVRNYLPDLMFSDGYAADHIRPRDLVSHQSGLPRHDLIWYGSSLSRKELYERLRYLESSAPLHAKYQYNNLMYLTAGVLLERISGVTWEEFVRRRILDPLGMKNSNLSVIDSQKTSDYSLPYQEEKGEVKEIPFRNIDVIGPAGSINSSVNEMTNWLFLQLNKGKAGEKQIISEKSLLDTQTPQIVSGGDLKYDESFYVSYGMGWAVYVYRGRPILQHGGGIDGFTSSVTLLPKDRIGVVVLTNSSSPASGIISRYALDRLLGTGESPWLQRAKNDAAKGKEAQAKAKAEDEAKRKKDTKTTLALKDYAGRFQHPAYQTLTITQQGEQLKGDLHGLPFTLKHYHYDVFEISDGTLGGTKVTFALSKAGEVDQVSIPIESSVKEIVFTRQKTESPREALISRAKSLELKTAYEPPPGNKLEHDAAGFAKIMCSAVFITGLDPGFAAENLGYFVSPYAERAKMGKPEIDRANKAVHISLPNGVKRTAKYLGSQGCVTFPIGKDSLNFKPVNVKSKLPDPATQPWPMGDKLPSDALPKEINAEKVKEAVSAAFEPAAALTAAFVVTWRGRIIAERYGDRITSTTPLESWSMGKSVTATLMGILIKQGVYKLDQPAPVPEWQNEGDPRAKITIADLLHMSSGLRIKAPGDPDYDSAGTYPDHIYLYTGGVDLFHYAATRPLQWPPNTVGRYRNTDPVLINYLARLGVEKRGEEYLSFPQRALFDKIGVRTMVMETDSFGNFLTQGYELASGRDWARLGNLYLQDGVWNGERILPEGFVKFVSTAAPAWVADNRPIYGGFFWINGGGAFPVPKEAFYMAGAGSQTTMILPSHELVVVRLGHFKGSAAGDDSFKKALGILMQAIPKRLGQ